jgi:hypothetical protein
VRDGSSGSLPAFELNYGLVPNGQLIIDAPVAFDSASDNSTQFGYGDTQISFKYRFIQEDEQGWRPQVAVFPLAQLPTVDQNRGLANTVEGHDSTGFNFGAIYDFNEHDHFLFSAGRGLQNADTTNDFSWSVGFLLTGP